MVKLILALDKYFGISKNNILPWHLTKDLKRFKNLTKNETVIMGRKTWDSLPNKFKPLPNRLNVMVSSQPPIQIHSKYNNVETSTNLFNTLNNYNNSWIIGGNNVYQQVLK